MRDEPVELAPAEALFHPELALAEGPFHPGLQRVTERAPPLLQQQAQALLMRHDWSIHLASKHRRLRCLRRYWYRFWEPIHHSRARQQQQQLAPKPEHRLGS